MQRCTANEERTPQNRRSIDRQKGKNQMKKRRTLQERPGENKPAKLMIQKSFFPSLIPSFVAKWCYGKKSSSAPPVKSTTTGGHRQRRVCSRARTEERRRWSSNQSSSHSKQWVFWSPISSKEAEKKQLRKQGIDKRRSTLTGTCQAPLERKIIARQKKTMAQRLATADDDGRRRRCETNDGNQKERKTSKESVFRPISFLFLFRGRRNCTSAVRSNSSSYGEGGGNVGRELRLGDSGVRWELASPWEPKELKKNIWLKCDLKFLFFLNKIRHYLALE